MCEQLPGVTACSGMAGNLTRDLLFSLLPLRRYAPRKKFGDVGKLVMSV